MHFDSLPEIHFASSGTQGESAVQPTRGDILGLLKTHTQKYEAIIHGTLQV